MQIYPADHQLTDAEILDRFGPLLTEAVEAFRRDPTYIADMADVWAKINTQREKRRAARETDTEM